MLQPLQTRILLVVTVMWFVFLFNIERLSLFGQKPFNLDTSTYVTAALISVALLAYPDLAYRNIWYSLGGVVTISIVVRTVMGYGWHVDAISQFFPEVVLVTATFILMRKVSHNLLGYETKLEALLLGTDSSRIVSHAVGEDQINQELYRARRFERPLAIVYCAGSEAINRALSNSSNDRDVLTDVLKETVRWNVSEHLGHRYQQSKLARIIEALTHKGDIIAQYSDGLIICLPENTVQDVAAFAHHLTALSHETSQFEPLIGVASFPDDGLVLDDLVTTARARARHVLSLNDPASSEAASNGDSNAGAPSSVPPTYRHGLRVPPEKRLQAQQDSEWVNDLAYQSPGARSIYRITKRVLDILIALMAMPALLTTMGIIALAIYLDDGLPIFFVQERTGYGGRRFRLYKFRTMMVNAPSIPPREVETPDGRIHYVWPEKLDNDPRITRVGRFLRKTSLDEIPQMFNILRGDMTLVGPRPTSWDLDKYTLHQTERLTVRPGLTGLWQIAARDTTNFDERLLWDMKYSEKMSLWMDAKIIWRTLAQLIRRKGT
jgi:lipopolysaccharide/colanic/teichoic acid biosynthesis glycosyltransferase